MMAKATLNSELIATKAGDVSVFNYDGETREYLSASVEYLAVGVGLPANSCIDVPGYLKKGFAICRTADLSSWEYITDHRDKTVFSIETMQPLKITALGDYPEGTTLEAPASPYDKWDGKKWVTDLAVKRKSDIADAEKKRQRLLAHADAIMADWRTGLMLGEISDTNRGKLSAWLAYKNEVKSADVTTDPEHVNWPVPPEA